MTDSTLLKRGQGNGDGVSVYICMNECQKRDELQTHQLKEPGGYKERKTGADKKKNGDQKKKVKLEENCFLLAEFPSVGFKRMT